MNGFARRVPIVVLILGAVFVVGAMAGRRASDGEMRLEEFGKIPIVHQGRCKPIDTLARTSLVVISGRQTFLDERGYSRPAIEWLLEVMSDALRHHSRAERLRVFRIENDQVLDLLGLVERPGFRYSIEEFRPKIRLIEEQAMRAQNKDSDKRDLFERKILELANKLQLYVRLANMEVPFVLPPRSGGDEWRTLRQAAEEMQRTGVEDPDARAWMDMLSAYAEGDASAFNTALEKYQSRVRTLVPNDVSRSRFETFFNAFQPFRVGMILYIICFLLVCVGWMGWQEPLRRSSVYLMFLGLLVHTFALIARMYIQERWGVFVTNLYSSAVFIGWGTVILGLGLERFSKNGIGAMVGAAIGFITLVIADNLAERGDTLEMMQAVLDTNFWLATHVTAVTIGYAATFVAGGLGIIFILRGLFSRSLRKEQVRNLGRITYGTVCFATFFSFTGTVLGGIWADQSWGRFWGWDPKENGALMIVLWNALILHARWGGMVRERGMAVLSVIGNIITAWSWFGVNMLGVGLHAYGFMDRALLWMVLFVLSQLAIIGLGLIPPKYWAGFKTEKESVPAV